MDASFSRTACSMMSRRDRLSESCARVIRWGTTGFAAAATISITATQIAYYSALAAWSVRAWKERRLPIPTSSFNGVIGLFFLAGVLSTFTSQRPLESLVGMKKLLLIPIVYVIADQMASASRARELARIVIGFAAIVSLYGIASYTFSGEARLMATQAMPITAGGLLMMVSCLAIPLAFYGTRGWERVLLLLSIGVMLLALILTKTRGAWIGFCAGVLAMAGVKGWRFLLGALLIVLVAWFLLPHELSERLMQGVRLEYEGVKERLAMWRASLMILHDFPVTGVGLIDLQQTHAVYSNPGVRKIHGHLHNNLVQVAVTMGIFGLTIFLGVLFTLVREQFAAHRRIAADKSYLKALSLGCLGVSVGFMTHGLFECTLCDAETVMLFWFVVGMSLGLKGEIDCALD